ncbi:MAG: hypothetical protein LBI14_10985 [Treponema sp.]|jgi:hypothetical protein|nr:hypothetical protein [Treponema sp.]
MKKYFLLFLFLAILIFSASAQVPNNEKERRFSIQVSPLLAISNIGLGKQYIYGTGKFSQNYGYLIGLEFQSVINKKFVFSIEPRFGISNYLDTYLTYGEYYGYGANGLLLDGPFANKLLLITLNPGILFKPFGTALKGWYVGLYGTIGYKNLSRNDERFWGYPDVNVNFLLLGITAGSGYQWVWNSGFTISLGAALSKVWEIGNKDPVNRYMVTEGFIPFDLIINFKIGFSF